MEMTEFVETHRGGHRSLQEASTKMKMQMVEAGAQQAPRRRRVRQKEKRIQNLFARFKSGAMSLNDYLEAMK